MCGNTTGHGAVFLPLVVQVDHSSSRPSSEREPSHKRGGRAYRWVNNSPGGPHLHNQRLPLASSCPPPPKPANLSSALVSAPGRDLKHCFELLSLGRGMRAPPSRKRVSPAGVGLILAGAITLAVIATGFGLTGAAFRDLTAGTCAVSPIAPALCEWCDSWERFACISGYAANSSGSTACSSKADCLGCTTNQECSTNESSGHQGLGLAFAFLGVCCIGGCICVCAGVSCLHATRSEATFDEALPLVQLRRGDRKRDQNLTSATRGLLTGGRTGLRNAAAGGGPS